MVYTGSNKESSECESNKISRKNARALKVI